MSQKKQNSSDQAKSYNQWKKQMPEWLKTANRAVEQGRLDQAAELLEEKIISKAIESLDKISMVFSKYSVAGLLAKIGQVKRAQELYEDILKENDHSAIYYELAGIYKKTGRLNKALIYYKIAMDQEPDNSMIWWNRAICLMESGEIEKAIELLKQTAQKMPDNNHVHSDLFLTMHYLADIKRSQIYEASRKWAQRNFPLSMAKTGFKNDRNLDRKLRVGYISPDFREHSVNYFFEPLLDAHNRDVVEIYGYGNVMHSDKTTERLKGKFDHYRNIRGLETTQAAELITSDKIDVLVDMAGHSGNSGIYVMGYKPAPVQVTWMGYPDTTGLTQIDYRITDEICDPPGAEKYHSEKLFYLPEGFLCYGPGEMMPPVESAPFLKTDKITFGSFNNNPKINSITIELWSRILKSVEGSSLLLKFKSGSEEEIRRMYLKRFSQQGIEPERIVISSWVSELQHLQLYGKVDIALDTFPYNGTTTTCEALLMGVPVITLCGDHHMSRVGKSILSRLGLEFFVASTKEEYIAKAVALAAKPDALAKIRENMRMRMAVSPLCNKKKFAENMENAYRLMWQTWCQGM